MDDTKIRNSKIGKKKYKQPVLKSFLIENGQNSWVVWQYAQIETALCQHLEIVMNIIMLYNSIHQINENI
jgi:hypothetical protein